MSEKLLRKPSVLRRARARFRAYPATATSEFRIYPEPTEVDRVLFFAPHPDDEALSAGGYLRRAVEAGAHCQVVLVTDGNRRGLKEIREQEFSSVLTALGIDPASAPRLAYVNGDPPKVDRARLLQQFRQLITEYRPTVVIAPHPADLHREHKVISELTSVIQAEAPTFDLLQYLIHYPPHYPWPRKLAPTAPLLPPVNLSHHKSDWVVFPLTSREVEQKREVIELYSSQLKTPVLRSLMYALVRSNELFRIFPKK